MMLTAMWRNQKDFEEDLIRYSEFSKPLNNKHVETPQTILEYRKQMEQNTTSPNRRNINETLTYVAKGRGLGIKDRIVRPGYNVEHHPLDDVELKKSIREVAGLGYSNELIETSFKVKSENRSKDTKSISSSSSRSLMDVEEQFQWVAAKQKFSNSQTSVDDESSSSASTSDELPKKFNRMKKAKCDDVIRID